MKIKWKKVKCMTIVLCSKGYPIKYESGNQIFGLESVKDDTSKVFHAGTSLEKDKLLTAGGRVLCVVGMGDNTKEAQRNSYKSVGKITWEDEFHRNDIGYRAIESE